MAAQSPLPPDYNVEVSRRTARWFWLAVVLPLVIAAVIVGVLTYLVAVQPEGGAHGRAVWSQIATVFLLAPVVVVTVVGLVALIAASAGVIWLMRKLPPIFKRVHDVLLRILHGVQRVTARLVSPLISAHAAAARVGRLRQRVAMDLPGRRPTGARP